MEIYRYWTIGPKSARRALMSKLYDSLHFPNCQRRAVNVCFLDSLPLSAIGSTATPSPSLGISRRVKSEALSDDGQYPN